MNSLVGFALCAGLSEDSLIRLETARSRALGRFKKIVHCSIQIGETQLYVWGHNDIMKRVLTLPDGSMVALIGSPHNPISWDDVTDDLLSNRFKELPWDGRLILLKISADGKHWIMWNDWLGSIPIFHAQIGGGRIASTLEPIVVSVARFSSADIFMPGLVSLMINGHMLGNWTLYKGMNTIPPDSVIEWQPDGIHTKTLWTVKPSHDHWETGWDDLVDEMYELSHNAIADILKTQPAWIVPLSSGLDSRLIAGVGADVGANLHMYAWGAPNTTDVIYSEKIAKTLGYPWKRIDLPADFLMKYTQSWADIFGSSMHFHGMYQMAFLDLLESELEGSIISGFIGDVLAGDDVVTLSAVHSAHQSVQIYDDWHVHWDTCSTETLLKAPLDDVLPQLSVEINNEINAFSGARYQNLLFLELWSRQRFFTSFQSTLSDYWRGVANPFMHRTYARFCMSLPRVALDNRRLLGDVFRRYYGRLAVIPGTYAKEPYRLTGQYLIKQRIARKLPSFLRRGPFSGFDEVPLRMDMEAVQASGKDALWPIYTAWDQLGAWLDVHQIEQAYQDVMTSLVDIRPLRKLQSVQALAYRLLNN